VYSRLPAQAKHKAGEEPTTPATDDDRARGGGGNGWAHVSQRHAPRTVSGCGAMWTKEKAMLRAQRERTFDLPARVQSEFFHEGRVYGDTVPEADWKGCL
jgi:hypothetical protein